MGIRIGRLTPYNFSVWNRGYFVFIIVIIIILHHLKCFSFFAFLLWVADLYADGFPIVGSTVGNIPCGQVLQYGRSTCFTDNRCQYEEYHESYVKVDGGNQDSLKGKDESGFALISTQGVGMSCLGKSQGSFKGIKEYKHGLEEKPQENARKSGLLRLAPSVSFNDKTPNRPSKRLSQIFRLSFKRRSCDIEDANELSKLWNTSIFTPWK